MDASTSNRQSFSAEEKASIARRVAKDVVASDQAIMSMLILDLEDKGQVLAVARSSNLPLEEYASPDLVHRFAIAAMVVWGAAESASQLMGRREFIVGAFEKQMVLLVGWREYGMLEQVVQCGAHPWQDR